MGDDKQDVCMYVVVVFPSEVCVLREVVMVVVVTVHVVCGLHVCMSAVVVSVGKAVQVAGSGTDAVHAGDYGYPNLSWLLTPVRNLRTGAENRCNEGHGRTRRVVERTFGLLKARFRSLVPYLQEESGDSAPVAAVDTKDREDEEEEEDVDKRIQIIQQYFQ
ncbi:hypothetical protein NDU88_002604 [Pleurodeles waltl]|uniref:DDE Tnp4 domain-containing protein n=1 Tax=Pleurodeles waltl TaxID=8319 RepID=A0AAV7M134_PLEWA|nr:hypothetical protein NDU88_002604 [Pleurodeles waltl]